MPRPTVKGEYIDKIVIKCRSLKTKALFNYFKEITKCGNSEEALLKLLQYYFKNNPVDLPRIEKY